MRESGSQPCQHYVCALCAPLVAHFECHFYSHLMQWAVYMLRFYEYVVCRVVPYVPDSSYFAARRTRFKMCYVWLTYACSIVHWAYFCAEWSTTATRCDTRILRFLHSLHLLFASCCTRQRYPFFVHTLPLLDATHWWNTTRTEVAPNAPGFFLWTRAPSTCQRVEVNDMLVVLACILLRVWYMHSGLTYFLN